MVQSFFGTPLLQNSISAKIPLIIQVNCQKISWKSGLGAGVCGLSFHLAVFFSPNPYILFFLILCIYLFLERGEGRDKEREGNISV